jgi:uncharacterized protein (TIGR03086 family)
VVLVVTTLTLSSGYGLVNPNPVGDSRRYGAAQLAPTTMRFHDLPKECIMPDTDLAQLHRQALTATRNVIAGIKPSQWHESTPCSEWDVRELANHLIAGNWWAAELANGATIASVGDRLDGDVLGTDPLSAYDKSAAVAAAIFEREGAMSAPCAVSYGPVPGSVYCGHRFVDVFVHGWDLAVATGQPTELDPSLVAACLDVVRPQSAMLAASGAFGDGGTSTLAEKNPQRELLTMLGRKP